MRVLVAVLVLGLCGPLCGADANAQNPVPASSPTLSVRQTRTVEAINTAKVLVQSHKPLEAINALDPILAEYEHDYVFRRAVDSGSSPSDDAVYVASGPDPKRRVYGARSQEEVIAYMLMASARRESAVAFDALWGNALSLKGYALIDLRRFPEAEMILREAVALSPRNAPYLIELGNLYTLQRRWDEASKVLDAATDSASLSPEPIRLSDQTHAWRARAYLYVELDHLDEAEALYRKCLEADPRGSLSMGELKYIAQKRSSGQLVKEPRL